MASRQPIIPEKGLKSDDPVVLLHRDILELSKAINDMKVVVESVNGLEIQTSADARMLATYADLADSLGKLIQAFEILHHHGDFNPGSGHDDKTVRPN